MKGEMSNIGSKFDLLLSKMVRGEERPATDARTSTRDASAGYDGTRTRQGTKAGASSKPKRASRKSRA